MKKKKKFCMLSCTAVVAMAGIAFVSNLYESSKEETSMLLENVEALSMPESPKTRHKCYTSFEYELGATVINCKGCKVETDKTDKLFNFHDYCFSH